MRHKILVYFFACQFLVFKADTALPASSGTVTITGSVPVACDVVVTAASGATGITDISAGDTDRSVATVTENCNDPDGYTVTVVGTNSGDHTGLFEDSVSSDTHPFTIKYNGLSVNSGGVVTNSNSPTGDVDKSVTISYSADSGLTATSSATYSETLTFTIAAK